ncbi:anhydro-N-acetylmuramic acid kinase [Prauserella muralis]|uniref:Anhydro-N-acetylmuramic acid kinase n=1 Tax=Prauserella muralis TaxID=588067 RepID=A0A2V4AYY0_9PSEU|nr:anhydro-N-acetylmuramic acid kinase [Prauserella muralis]PXY27102.1 anhydro-N-acetylmuramic acid kinase [Prauserella muralis]TWE23262.1 anhydro-N-acetylmuramic acid kinase [Prauserella muralis]
MADSPAALRVAGLISGTSVDGIDVALAALHADGEDLVLEPLGHLEVPYPGTLRDDLLAALPPGACDAERLTRLHTGVGQAFAEAAVTAIDRFGGGHADLVASLGQTIFHWVEGGTARGTLQLGQPAWIAERTGLPVIADLRARDVAAGGHGAPLASTLDALWLRALAEREREPVAALNLGGIANLTVVRAGGAVLAYDTGPGNALLDAAATEVTGGAWHSDVDGALAAQGTVHPGLLDRLLADPYYAAPPPKSTGKEHFHAAYLHEALAGLPQVSGPDLLATLTELTAVTVARECARHGVSTVVASGGGLRNPALVRALGARVRLAASDEHGLPSDAKEAYLTAVLGWLGWHGVCANVPAATGARGPRLLGSITPGDSPLSLPASRPVITRLRVAKPTPTR